MDNSFQYRPHNEQKRIQLQPTNIEIHTNSPQDPAGQWRYARLSYDATSKINRISQRLVTKVLAKPICAWDKESGDPILQQRICNEIGVGYVDLVWGFERSPRRVYGPTRFIVSTEWDPPYDAVLGQNDTKSYLIMKERGCE